MKMNIWEALKLIAIIITIPIAAFIGAVFGIIQGVWNNPMTIVGLLGLVGLATPFVLLRKYLR